MYGIEQEFWLKLITLIIILGVIIYSFNLIMRRVLKVEKKKFFSNTHINETHKKVDRIIRITVVVLIIIGFFYNVTRVPNDYVWYFQPWFFLLILVIATESVTAFMEWKYASNRKDYILTISQLIFLLLLTVIVFSTNFFWLT